MLEAAKLGDGEALEELFLENRGLVVFAASRFLAGAEREDVLQAGSVGLVKAILGFEPSYGTEFSTYAVPKIAGEIRKLLRGLSHTEVLVRCDPGTPSAEEKALDRIYAAELLRALPEREALVVALRYCKGLTQKETGERIGLSQSSVSRIEKKAVSRMREGARRE